MGQTHSHSCLILTIFPTKILKMFFILRIHTCITFKRGHAVMYISSGVNDHYVD